MKVLLLIVELGGSLKLAIFFTYFFSIVFYANFLTFFPKVDELFREKRNVKKLYGLA